MNIDHHTNVIGARLLDAALQAHRGNAQLREAVLETDHRLPLHEHYVRICAFILQRKATSETALTFVDEIADADAIEFIFDDALPVLEASGIDAKQIALFKGIGKTVKWMQKTAYEVGPAMRQGDTRPDVAVMFDQPRFDVKR